MPVGMLEFNPVVNQLVLSTVSPIVFILSLKFFLFFLRCLFVSLPLHLTTSTMVFTQIAFLLRRPTPSFDQEIVVV